MRFLGGNWQKKNAPAESEAGKWCMLGEVISPNGETMIQPAPSADRVPGDLISIGCSNSCPPKLCVTNNVTASVAIDIAIARQKKS